MEITFNHVPFAELQAGNHFAPDLEKVNWISDWSCHLADSPAAFALADLYQAAGVPPPGELTLHGRFALWLIPHRVSIVRRGGMAKPKRVEVEVEFRNDAEHLNEKMTLFVVSLLPAPQFVRVSDLQVEVTGSIKTDGEVVATLPHLDLPHFSFRSGGLTVGTSAKLGGGLYFRQQLSTPIVSAVGVGSSRAHWLLTEADLPLYGRDLECWTVLALPKRTKKLSYRMRVRLHMREGLFDVPYESDWKPITSELTQPAAEKPAGAGA